MPAPVHLSLPAQYKPMPGTPGETEDARYCVFSAEGAHVETPLTSEPPLPDVEPLTSEPPLTDLPPLTSESDALVDTAGTDLFGVNPFGADPFGPGV